MKFTNILMAGASIGCLSIAPAMAQTAAEDNATLGEIVVTAQKRTERLQDVPMAVSAVEGQALVAQNLVSIQDFAAKVPNVNVGGNLTSDISIRGVSTGGGTNPTVAIVIDDVPFGSAFVIAQSGTPDLDPSQIARIEVLRGPQGTLYGAASLGGLIKYVTKSPDYNDYTGRLEIGGQSLKHGESGYSTRAAVNLPLIADKVALALSGFYRQEPGYIDNDLAGLKDANDAYAYGLRAALGVKLSDRIDVSLSALSQDRKAKDPSTVDYRQDYSPVTTDLSHSMGPAIASSYNLFRLYQGRIEASYDFATLTALTGYGQSRTRDNQDYTATFAPLFPLFGLPASASAPYANGSRGNKFSQEVRLASPDGAPFEWLIGGFYSRETNRATQQIDAVQGSQVLVNLVSANLPTRYKEAAAFGSATVKFSERFDVQAGARYGENRQSFRYDVSGALTGGAVNVLGRSKEDAFTWQVTPRWRLVSGAMAYARLATGYRPGGPNVALPGNPPTFGSDTTTNYELGLKGDLAGRRFTYDVSLYWIDWKDIQLNLSNPATGLTFFGNGGGARSRGLELSGVYRAAPGLTFGGNLTLAQAKLTDDLPANSAIGRTGDRLPFQAKTAGNLTADYEFDLSATLTGSVGATFTYVGERLGGFQPNSSPRLRLDSYSTIDLRAGVRTPKGLSFNAYLRNLGDERGWASGAYQSAGVPAAGYSVQVIQPRTIGVIIAQSF